MEEVFSATTPLGRAVEALAMLTMELARSAGVSMTGDQLTAAADAVKAADEAGKTISNLTEGVARRDPFDHDGDGKPGGSTKKT